MASGGQAEDYPSKDERPCVVRCKGVSEITMAKRGLIYGTKFDHLFSYRMANLHYLVAEQELLAAHEVPNGWGLFVGKPVWQDIQVEVQVNFLQRIAVCRGVTAEQPSDSWKRVFSTPHLGSV
jgi:hypothetical protein